MTCNLDNPSLVLCKRCRDGFTAFCEKMKNAPCFDCRRAVPHNCQKVTAAKQTLQKINAAKDIEMIERKATAAYTKLEDEAVDKKGEKSCRSQDTSRESDDTKRTSEFENSNAPYQKENIRKDFNNPQASKKPSRDKDNDLLESKNTHPNKKEKEMPHDGVSRAPAGESCKYEATVSPPCSYKPIEDDANEEELEMKKDTKKANQENDKEKKMPYDGIGQTRIEDSGRYEAVVSPPCTYKLIESYANKEGPRMKWKKSQEQPSKHMDIPLKNEQQVKYHQMFHTEEEIKRCEGGATKKKQKVKFKVEKLAAKRIELKNRAANETLKMPTKVLRQKLRKIKCQKKKAKEKPPKKLPKERKVKVETKEEKSKL